MIIIIASINPNRFIIFCNIILSVKLELFFVFLRHGYDIKNTIFIISCNFISQMVL